MVMSLANGTDRSARAKDIDPQLLEETQNYLRARLAGLDTNPGLRGAWDEFFAAHDPLVHAVVRRYVSRPADQADCAQEVWCQIVLKLPTFGLDIERGRFRSWLFTLARNKAIDVVRGAATNHQTNVSHLLELWPSGDQGPAARYELRRERRVAREALRGLNKHLSPTNRQVVTLCLVDGVRVCDVAARLHLSENQVNCRVWRLRNKLHRTLQAHGQGELCAFCRAHARQSPS